FVETEESYTSKASFLDDDFLPTFGAKPESWKPSGKRVKRGLYCTQNGLFVNADCNGAANILRKAVEGWRIEFAISNQPREVAATLGLCLKEVSSGVLTTPVRVHYWAASESPSL
ncbi:hypothetical protein VB714_06975, partial [Spirulina sp. 06S082]|nr:hypothetical protein [Spirulina sp. 06S082]